MVHIRRNTIIPFNFSHARKMHRTATTPVSKIARTVLATVLFVLSPVECTNTIEWAMTDVIMKVCL